MLHFPPNHKHYQKRNNSTSALKNTSIFVVIIQAVTMVSSNSMSKLSFLFLNTDFSDHFLYELNSHFMLKLVVFMVLGITEGSHRPLPASSVCSKHSG